MDKVSTHASREGRDLSPSLRLTWLSCFNSCAPQRTRLVLRDKPDNASQFQLTRPAKDATRALVFGAVQALVSTHASSKGRDADNSRRSAREDVSTHASREGRDDISRIHRYDNTQRPRLRDGSRRRWFYGADAARKRWNLQARCADVSGVLYSFNFLRKRLLIVIPRLTRNLVASNSDALRYLTTLASASGRRVTVCRSSNEVKRVYAGSRFARLFCISVGGLRLQASDASIWHSVNFF